MVLTALVLSMSPYLMQDRQEPEDDELTPAQAIELLKEAYEHMVKVEELLNDSSRGKALETEKELLAKLERDFKDIPAGEIMKRVQRVIEKAQKRQRDANAKLDEIIKKARSSSGKGGSEQTKGEEPKDSKGQPKSQKQAGSPADKAYDPNRTDDVSKFRSTADRTGSWGNLPPSARKAIMDAAKAEIPSEFQDQWSDYSRRLMGENQ